MISKIYRAGVLAGEFPSGKGLCRTDDWMAECRRRSLPSGGESVGF